jgi:hypothetical protein
MGYVTLRVVESVIIVAGVVSVLCVLRLRQQFAGTGADAETLTIAGQSLVAFHDATFLLGPGFCAGIGNGLMLGYIMYRSGLLPRRLAAFGLFAGTFCTIAATGVRFDVYEPQSGPHMLLTFPEMIWELTFGVYLIASAGGPSTSPIIKGTGEPLFRPASAMQAHPARPCGLPPGLFGGHQHGVDDVHDAVGGVDVGGCDRRVAHADSVPLDRDLEGVALDGLELLAVLEICGHQLAGYDVVGEDVGELLFAFGREQLVEGFLAHGTECVVGRREHRERSLALKRLGELCGSDGGHERGEVGCRRGQGDDVLLGGGGRRRLRRRLGLGRRGRRRGGLLLVTSACRRAQAEHAHGCDSGKPLQIGLHRSCSRQVADSVWTYEASGRSGCSHRSVGGFALAEETQLDPVDRKLLEHVRAA